MQNNLLAELPLQQLKQAVAIREKIDALEKELARIVGGQLSTMKAQGHRRKRRFSAAGGRNWPFFPAVARQICLILLAIQALPGLSGPIFFKPFGVRFGVRLPTCPVA